MQNPDLSSTQSPPVKVRVSFFASVKLTIILFVLIAGTVLLGAWCPQESQVGQEKIVEQFGPDLATKLIDFGIADIFHTPWFLGLIGMLTVNMVACSVQRVFPKVRSMKQKMPFLGRTEIERLPVNRVARFSASAGPTMGAVTAALSKMGYNLASSGYRITGEWGKYSKLAATITHIGLLTLLAGVTITSWTGFSGFQPVLLEETMDFQKSEHSKLWLGKLPTWKVRVDATRRENYESGDAKQWYSTLTVLDPSGKALKTQEISVNNPLSYDGVDIYQSSWGLEHIIVSFNGNRTKLPLRPMGSIYAAFLPLDKTTILLFSVRDQSKPAKIFAKIPEWPAPRQLAEIAPGASVKMGNVDVRYEKCVPVTGLQYKSDPGLPVTYVSFIFICVGIMLAAVPHRQVWCSIVESPDGCELAIGGVSRKAKGTFEASIKKLCERLNKELGSAVAEPTGSDRAIASSDGTDVAEVTLSKVD